MISKIFKKLSLNDYYMYLVIVCFILSSFFTWLLWIGLTLTLVSIIIIMYKYYKQIGNDIENFLYPQERIQLAAIHFDDGKEYYHQPKNIKTGIVMCGYRHACIFSQTLMNVKEREEKGFIEKSQGFITNLNRYVERKEALEIALAANQVKDLKEIRGNRLFSEDLY